MAQQETARERALIALGLLAFCAGLIVLLLALLLGFHLASSSPSTEANTAMGQLIAIPAAIALIAGVTTLAGRRRRWALAVGWVGASAAALAVLLAILIPSG